MIFEVVLTVVNEVVEVMLHVLNEPQRKWLASSGVTKDPCPPISPHPNIHNVVSEENTDKFLALGVISNTVYFCMKKLQFQMNNMEYKQIAVSLPFNRN